MLRPALTVPRPRDPGLQTAIVTGPDDEEVYCDDQGRIRVAFHWDHRGRRDAASSCWIRVAPASSCAPMRPVRCVPASLHRALPALRGGAVDYDRAFKLVQYGTDLPLANMRYRDHPCRRLDDGRGE